MADVGFVPVDANNLTLPERSAAFMRLIRVHGHPPNGRIPEIVATQPRFGGLSLDKFLQGVYNSFAGMNWEFTKFMLQDLTRLGRWMENVFPIMLWKDAQKKYANYFGAQQGEMVEIFSEWKMETFVYGQKNRRSPGTIYDIGRRRAETRSFIFRGGGFRLPMRFALQNTTAALAMKQLERMDFNIYKTLAFEMVNGTVDEAIRATMMREQERLPFHSTEKVLAKLDFKRQYEFIFHKGQDGFKKFENAAYQLMANQEIYPNFLLTHMSTMQYVHLDERAQGEFALKGPKSQDDEYRVTQLDPDGRGRTPLHKWKVVCSIPFLLGEDKRIVDPTLLLHRFGLWYQMRLRSDHLTSKCYKHDHLDIRVTDISKKRYEELSFRKAIQSMGIWNSRGDLDNVGRLGLMVLMGIIDPPNDRTAATLLDDASSLVLDRASTGPYRSKLKERVLNNWSAMLRPDILGMISGDRDLAVAVSRPGGGPWQPGWKPSDRNHYDGLPNIANALTLYSTSRGILEAFLCQVRHKSAEDLLCWEKIIDIQSVARSGAGGVGAVGGGRGRFASGGGRAPVADVSRRDGRPVPEGGEIIFADRSKYGMLSKVLLCLPFTVKFKVTADPLLLPDLEQLAEVAYARLACDGPRQLSSIQLKHFALVLIRLLRGERSTQLELYLRELQGIGNDNREVHLSDLVDKMIKDVVDKKVGVYDHTLFSDIGLDKALNAEGACGPGAFNKCGKSDAELKIMLQKTRVSRDFIQYLLDQDLFIPISPLLLQPDITLTTCANVVALVGPRTGCLCIKDPEVTWTPEVNHATIEVQCALRARLLIINLDNLLIMPHASVFGYHAGGGTAFVQWEKYTRLENRGKVPPHDHGIFVIPERIDYVPPHTVISKCGSWHPGLFGPAEQPLHFPNAAFARRRWKWAHESHFLDVRGYPMDPQGEKEAWTCAPPNDLCYAAGYFYKKESNGMVVEIQEAGDSQFGNEVSPASAKIMHGEPDALDTLPNHSIVSALRAAAGGPR